MNTLMKTVSLAMCAVLATGCVSQSYKDVRADTERTRDNMRALTPNQPLNYVSSIVRPPVQVKPLARQTDIPYLKDNVKLHVSGLPLSQVLSEVMRGSGVDIWYDNDVNPSAIVSLSANTSRQGALNLLASQTKYAIVPGKDMVEVRHFLSETFRLNIPVGELSAQQGDQGNISGDGKSTRVEGQYISVKHDSVNMVQEVSDAIKAVLKSEDDDGTLIGDVQSIPSLTSFVVRTTPDRMRQVRNIVDQYQQELEKQVLLSIQVLEFRSNLGKDQGIDWNILKDIGDGTLQFVIPGTTTTSNGGGFGMAFQGSGKWDGTTAFIKALEQQGSVAVDTPINIQTLSNQPAWLQQDLKTPFLADIKVDTNDNSSSTETVRDSVSEGVDMFVSANVQHDHVWLRLSGALTKIAGDTTETVNEAKLRFISTRNVNLSFTNKLRYGQSVVIGSIKQHTQGANKSSSFGISGLGSQATNTETVETLIILTPRRVQ